MSSIIRPTHVSPQSRALYVMRGLKLLVLSLLLILAIASSLSVVTTNAAQKTKPKPPPAYFTGEVEYRVGASGTNKDGVAAFKMFSPTTIKVVYGKQGFRLIETGGSGYNVLLNYDTGAAYLLDAEEKTATKINYGNIDENAGQMAAILPFHYKTEMQPTGKTATIGGQLCSEYKVLKSGFIREGAKASVWVAEGVKFKPSRYSFENETHRVDSPLPLSVPVPKGAIMKMEIDESGVEAVYEVVKITPGAPETAMFSVPAGYSIKSDK